MGYYDLLKKSPADLNLPMTWHLPGGGMGGGLTLCNGALLRLGLEVKALTDKPVLVVMGPVVGAGETGAIVRKLLAEASVPWDLFSGISGEPDECTVWELLRVMAGREYGAVVGVGGGSAMDVAKLAGHAADEGASREKLGKGDFSAPGLPTILVPTTAGSGSETSPYAVLTMEGKKVFFTSRTLLAATAIVDPLVMASMPPKLTAATAFDAMTHAVEGATARPSPYTGALAAEAAALVMDSLPDAMERGEDVRARYRLALASVMGMMAYSMGGGLYAHSISYQLTLRKGIPHGAGCGLALPFTMAYNRAAAGAFLDRLAARILGRCDGEGAHREVIGRIRRLYLTAKLPADLGEAGFSEGDVLELAEELLCKYRRDNNPRGMTEEDARSLFAAMLAGEIAYF